MMKLTQIQRQYLKQASSNLSPESFMALPEEKRDVYTRQVNKVIYGLMEINPDAFTETALEEHKKKNRLTYDLGS
jgi:hypothetical protein